MTPEQKQLLRDTVVAMRMNPGSDMWCWRTPCGTAGCIAGTRLLLDGGRLGFAETGPILTGADFGTGVVVSIETWAMGRFGLSEPALFHLGAWPNPLKMAYADARTHSTRMDAVAAAVEYFIAEEEKVIVEDGTLGGYRAEVPA